jgi:hypothetical protein
VGAGDAAADDHHAPRRDAGHAAEEDAGPAVLLLQAHGAHLDRHASGDLAHGPEQGQAALGGGHGLVGDGRGAGVHESFGLARIRGQVEVGEERVVRPEPGALLGLRLLDLHDQLRAAEDRVGVVHEGRAGGRVGVVGHADAEAGTALDEHLVPVLHELAHRGRHEAHAVLVVLDLPGYADAHGRSLPAGGCGRAGGPRSWLYDARTPVECACVSGPLVAQCARKLRKRDEK